MMTSAHDALILLILQEVAVVRSTKYHYRQRPAVLCTLYYALQLRYGVTPTCEQDYQYISI
ncbi:uncharacterized protein TrAFT101_001617 [Trichoderma asperellum]|uniref:uncharacterized protein n=1 Tax=Trichoderma asperellum TaxID=101201 RepID=UPI003317BA7E|nr:hypothetical protein TrAFT101_001617 [Trichoderma asperellum]